MRNTLILSLILLPIILLAQPEQGTTLDEYKYLSKGYAYQKEMGLGGEKNGYDVKPLLSASNGIQFFGLMKGNGDFRGIIVVINPDSKKPIYLGLPTNDASPKVKKIAEEDAKEKLNLNAKEKYDKALLELAMQQLSGGETVVTYIGETEKNLKGNPVPPKNEMVDEYNTVIPLTIDNEKMTERSGTTAMSTEINHQVKVNHNFSERTFVNPPVVRGQNPTTGTVVIKMCIDQNGNVKTAKFTQRGSTTFNKRMRNMALEAAKKVKFSAGLDAEQCGMITFIFGS